MREDGGPMVVIRGGPVVVQDGKRKTSYTIVIELGFQGVWFSISTKVNNLNNVQISPIGDTHCQKMRSNKEGRSGGGSQPRLLKPVKP